MGEERRDNKRETSEGGDPDPLRPKWLLGPALADLVLGRKSNEIPAKSHRFEPSHHLETTHHSPTFLSHPKIELIRLEIGRTEAISFEDTRQQFVVFCDSSHRSPPSKTSIELNNNSQSLVGASELI
ncbi:hypothetical protein ACFX2F_034992 [Malus domestica]